MTKLKTLENRLEELITAHRIAAARQEAVFMVCRVMLPLIKVDSAAKQRLITYAYDNLSTHMENSEFDDEYQKYARAAIDELFSTH